jgi:hypothetical protein
MGQKIDAKKEVISDPEDVEVGGEKIKNWATPMAQCAELAEKIKGTLRDIVNDGSMVRHTENTPVPPPDEPPF